MTYRASLGTRGELRRIAAEAETATIDRVRPWVRKVQQCRLAPHVIVPQWTRLEHPVKPKPPPPIVSRARVISSEFIEEILESATAKKFRRGRGRRGRPRRRVETDANGEAGVPPADSNQTLETPVLAEGDVRAYTGTLDDKTQNEAKVRETPDENLPETEGTQTQQQSVAGSMETLQQPDVEMTSGDRGQEDIAGEQPQGHSHQRLDDTKPNNEIQNIEEKVAMMEPMEQSPQASKSGGDKVIGSEQTPIGTDSLAEGPKPSSDGGDAKVADAIPATAMEET